MVLDAVFVIDPVGLTKSVRDLVYSFGPVDMQGSGPAGDPALSRPFAQFPDMVRMKVSKENPAEFCPGHPAELGDLL